jgi:flagellin-like protein
MKNFKRSKKALSPVVASIILIAVTVAVSIAVAAWMGALSIGFMATEQMSITNAQFTGNGTTILLSVRNTGTTDIVIDSATVNGVDATSVAMAPDTTKIAKNSDGTVTVTLATNWQSGYSYQIRLLSAKGNYFPYNAVAP